LIGLARIVLLHNLKSITTLWEANEGHGLIVKHGHVVSGRRPLEQRHATLSIAEPGSTHVSPVRTALQLSNLERINADTRRPVTV